MQKIPIMARKRFVAEEIIHKLREAEADKAILKEAASTMDDRQLTTDH